MYTPTVFEETDLERLFELIQAYPFALLTTWPMGVPVMTHLPLILEAGQGEYGTLFGHLAKKNPQSQHLIEGTEALIIFQGAHAYISPTWYAGHFNVPTWNYTAVHAHGQLQPITDATSVRQILDAQTAHYESHMRTPWSIPWDDERNHHMLTGLVAFQMPIERLEGKFKLNQNKTAADRQNVIETLSASEREGDQNIARLMLENSTG